MENQKRLELIEAKDRLITLSHLALLVKDSKAILSNEKALTIMDSIVTSILEVHATLEHNETELIAVSEANYEQSKKDFENEILN